MIRLILEDEMNYYSSIAGIQIKSNKIIVIGG